MGSPLSTRLTQGMPAPNFTKLTHDGKKISLEDFRGQKVWLCLYRYATCPLCNLHLAEVRANAAEIKAAGAQVLAVFESPAESFAHFSRGETQDLPPLIPDPHKELYRVFGAERSFWAMLKPQVAMFWIRAQLKGYFQKKVEGELLQVPAQFLIREDGVLHTAFYGEHIGDHIPWWRVRRFLAEESVKDWKARIAVR